MNTFLEDIYIASKDLYSELVRQGATDSLKIENTLYKYWSRACTRATPFGLFSCCSTGIIDGEKTRIEVSPPDGIVRTTRLDTCYVCALVQYLESLPIIKSQLRFFPNDSIYQVGNRIRYVEYYYKSTRRIHQIQEVDSTSELLSVLDFARTGKTIEQLSLPLVSSQNSFSDAKEFVISLIDNQILKSEIEVNISGEDPLSRIICVLKDMRETTTIVDSLLRINLLLSRIDKDLCHNASNYEELEATLKSFPVDYEDKYLLQTNSFRPSAISHLSSLVVSDIQDALLFLKKLNKGNVNTPLQSFFSAFLQRYEGEAIPLLEVLDGDIGLGYPVDDPKIINNPLLRDYPIGPSQSDNKRKISLNIEECIILRKFTEQAQKGFPLEILLEDSDIKEEDIQENQSYFETIPVMCHLIGKDIYLHSAGGASSSSLLGRFHSLDPSINNLIKDICEKEQEGLPDDTVAVEILHLPDSRVGNISTRPCHRNAEVHYLARSGASHEKSIPVSDLMMQYKNGKVVLFSKSLQKKVFFFLSNAHNYSFGTPVYHFLCDYQYAFNKTIKSLRLDNLLSTMKYLPRIRYRNVLLHLRSWVLDYDSLFGKGIKIIESAYHNLDNWREKRSIPDTIILKEMDNTLLLDLNNGICREILIEKVRKVRRVILEETAFPDKNVFPITDGNNYYCAEIIIPFFKTK